MYRQSLIVPNYYLSNCINNTSVCVVRCALCVVRCALCSFRQFFHTSAFTSTKFVDTVSHANEADDC